MSYVLFLEICFGNLTVHSFHTTYLFTFASSFIAEKSNANIVKTVELYQYSVVIEIEFSIIMYERLREEIIKYQYTTNNGVQPDIVCIYILYNVCIVLCRGLY